jgi:hypothetical protein
MNAGDPKNIISCFCREFHNALTIICPCFAGQLFRVQDLSQSGDGGLRKRFTPVSSSLRVANARQSTLCRFYVDNGVAMDRGAESAPGQPRGSKAENRSRLTILML